MHFEGKITKHESHWQCLGYTRITEKPPSFWVLGLCGILYCKVSSKDDGSKKMSNGSDLRFTIQRLQREIPRRVLFMSLKNMDN